MNPTLRFLLNVLREAEPPLLPVYVRCKPKLPADFTGLCWVERDVDGSPLSFRIDLLNLHPRVMWFNLLHEWAHALTWQNGLDVRDHCAGFQATLKRMKQRYHDKRTTAKALQRVRELSKNGQAER